MFSTRYCLYNHRGTIRSCFIYPRFSQVTFNYSWWVLRVAPNGAFSSLHRLSINLWSQSGITIIYEWSCFYIPLLHRLSINLWSQSGIRLYTNDRAFIYPCSTIYRLTCDLNPVYVYIWMIVLLYTPASSRPHLLTHMIQMFILFLYPCLQQATFTHSIY